LRELRDLVRYRKAKIQERTREVQRVEKTLQDAGIKLSSVASEVLGKSARLMLDALICGTHDPEVLADLAKGALRKKIPALREALQGRFTGHHALLIGQMLAQIDFLDETIATLSRASAEARHTTGLKRACEQGSCRFRRVWPVCLQASGYSAAGVKS
jgi:transposase